MSGQPSNRRDAKGDKGAETMENREAEEDMPLPSFPPEPRQKAAYSKDAPVSGPRVAESNQVNGNPNAVAMDIQKSIDSLGKTMDQLQALFSQRLQYDQTKETVIDRQHQELKALREGIKNDLLRPILYDIAAELDDIRQMKIGLGDQPGSQLAAEQLTNVEDVLKDILNKNDVEQVSSQPGEPFQGKWQRMVKPVDTDDPNKHKTIARSLAPGYRRGQESVFKERVTVYRLLPSSHRQHQPGDLDSNSNIGTGSAVPPETQKSESRA